MKISTKAHFLSHVKESASAAVQKGEQISYDLEDANTRQYASDLLNQVREAAGADTTWDDLFKWTAEDFCTTLTDLTFPSVKESSAKLDKTDDEIKGLVSKVADDAGSIHQLLQNASDTDLLVEQLGLVEESAKPEVEADPTEDEAPEGTEAVAESTDDEAPEGTEVVAESTDDEAPEGTEAVAESTDDEAPEGTEAVAESTDDEAPEGTEAVAESTDEEAPEGTEAVAEAGVENPFRVVTDSIDESEWPEMDRGAIKTRLRVAKEAGAEGIDDIIQEVYAVVGDVEDPATWKYPHHVVTESGDVLLNKTGLSIASSYVSTRFHGSHEAQQTAAKALSAHYQAIEEDTPATIARVAESTGDVHMISLEILDVDDKVLTLDNTTGDAAVGICVAESVANSLHNTGLVAIDDPTVIRIDSDQLGVMTTNLTGFINTMMGNDVEPVTESVPDTTELDNQIQTLSGELDLYKKKVDALHSLLDGSPLEGVAESVVSAEQVESVEALKSVADSIGVKRLITTRRQTESTPGEVTPVAESAAGLDSLTALSQLVSSVTEAKVTETPVEPVIGSQPDAHINRLTNFV